MYCLAIFGGGCHRAVSLRPDRSDPVGRVLRHERAIARWVAVSGCCPGSTGCGCRCRSRGSPTATRGRSPRRRLRPVRHGNPRDGSLAQLERAMSDVGLALDAGPPDRDHPRPPRSLGAGRADPPARRLRGVDASEHRARDARPRGSRGGARAAAGDRPPVRRQRGRAGARMPSASPRDRIRRRRGRRSRTGS